MFILDGDVDVNWFFYLLWWLKFKFFDLGYDVVIFLGGVWYGFIC